MDRDATRTVSATLFNNDKLVEVVLAIARWDGPAFTIQEIATKVAINHDLAKKVVNRLEAVDMLKRQPRLGGRRGALPFEVQGGRAWDALVRLAEAIAAGG